MLDLFFYEWDFVFMSLLTRWLNMAWYDVNFKPKIQDLFFYEWDFVFVSFDMLVIWHEMMLAANILDDQFSGIDRYLIHFHIIT